MRNHLLSQPNKFKYALLILIYLFSLSLQKANSQKADLPKYYDNIPEEKVYLHCDKTFYNAGDELWFKVYLVDASTNKPQPMSNVVYVELINPVNEIIITKIISITKGTGNGNLSLPTDLLQGKYLIRAYTNYLRNFDNSAFFKKYIYINSLKPIGSERELVPENETFYEPGNKSIRTEKPDVQFFPEGGYLVNGFFNRLGIKATDKYGKGVDITGRIIDNKGDTIAEFTTLKFGLGETIFTPEKEKFYKAQIYYNNNSYLYDLPAALSKGSIIQVTELTKYYQVIIQTSKEGGINNYKFITSCKNKVVNIISLNGPEQGARVVIPKNILKEGITQFTLFNNEDIPVCERLVYFESGDSVQEVEIANNKNEYGTRELVEFNISPKQDTLNFSDADISISVAQALASPDNLEYDIKSYLLLSSEIKGEIEQPGYYFYSKDPNRKKMLNLLLMTQGWRRYLINDTNNEEISSQEFNIESGLEFEGQVIMPQSRKRQKQVILSLTAYNKDEFSQYETETDKDGHFRFSDISFLDTTTVIIQSPRFDKKVSNKNSNINYQIQLNELLPPSVDSCIKNNLHNPNEIFAQNYPFSSYSKKEIDSIYSLNNTTHILLDEVSIVGKKIDKKAKKRTMYFEPNYSVDFEALGNSVPLGANVIDFLIGRVPNLSIGIGKNGEPTAFLRGPISLSGSAGALFLLDGLPVTPGAILSIPIQNIQFVDVLVGPKTIIFGTDAAGGVIAVYTYDASDILSFSDTTQTKGIITFEHPGFSVPKEFYSPNYSIEKENPEKPDKRNTLYWNPNVKLEQNSKTHISFYTSDLISDYKIIFEGIASNGTILHSETKFSVK